MIQPNDQAVEAAARAMFEAAGKKDWENSIGRRGLYFVGARIALRAALPHLTQPASAAETVDLFDSLRIGALLDEWFPGEEEDENVERLKDVLRRRLTVHKGRIGIVKFKEVQ